MTTPVHKIKIVFPGALFALVAHVGACEKRLNHPLRNSLRSIHKVALFMLDASTVSCVR